MSLASTAVECSATPEKTQTACKAVGVSDVFMRKTLSPYFPLLLVRQGQKENKAVWFCPGQRTY